MEKKKAAKAAKRSQEDTTEKRERGPIICKPGSKRAKQIEATHGFNAALKKREKRDQGAAGEEKGDS